MGGTHSVEYVTDPQVMKQIQQLQKANLELLKRQPQVITNTIYKSDPKIKQELDRMRKQLEETKDPKNMAQNVSKMKNLYWQDLKQMKFPKNRDKSVIFIGRTSVGKSSLLNTLFKIKLPTSKGTCTQQISIVANFKGINVFDCPGLDTHFDLIKQPEKIPQYLGCMDVICYLYHGSIEEDILKTFSAMRKTIIGVRTMCDPDDEESGENDALRKKDEAQFAKYGVNTQIFFTSKKGSPDNSKLLEYILS